MADTSWNVQIGDVGERGGSGVPPVPETVYQGDEDGARAKFAERSAAAASGDTCRYVLLRNVGDVIEVWGTPPAVA